MSNKEIRIEQEAEYLASLKSIETENYVDRLFYRPIGFKIAKALTPTGIHPNTITLISIIIGMAGGALFYVSEPFWVVLVAIALMVGANILDCVDGQLARLTGIKSEVGRILDGLAGYLWFLTLYLAIALRVYDNSGFWPIFIIALISMLSHALQAGITDYYKTLHLRFISKETGKEFETFQQAKLRIKAMKPSFNKVLSHLYLGYMWVQCKLTPNMQHMIATLQHKKELGADKRVNFRKGSKLVMKLVDLMTFNGRTIPLFLIALTGHPEFYFVYEIVFLNIVLGVAIKQHEGLCLWLEEEVTTDGQ